MGYLKGLKQYLAKSYSQSVFDTAVRSRKNWEVHIHGRRVIAARILKNLKYDVLAAVPPAGVLHLPKLQIKLLYPLDDAPAIRQSLKIDKEVLALMLKPVVLRAKRRFVKNKSLFPLMVEKKLLCFTLLEGEMLCGVITDFNRYEISMGLVGGAAVGVLRHAVYDVCDEQGRSYLKEFQEIHRDWEKSPLYVP